MQSMIADLGVTTHVRVWTESNAAKAIASRRGLGKTRHVELRYLWLQDVTKSGRVKMRRIPDEQNLADPLTKGKAWYLIETSIRGVGGIMKMSGDGKESDERKKWQGGCQVVGGVHRDGCISAVTVQQKRCTEEDSRRESPDSRYRAVAAVRQRAAAAAVAAAGTQAAWRGLDRVREFCWQTTDRGLQRRAATFEGMEEALSSGENSLPGGTGQSEARCHVLVAVGLAFTMIWVRLVGKTDAGILMVELDAAGQITILFKLKLGEIVTTIATIGRKVETVQYKNLCFAMRGAAVARTRFSLDGDNIFGECTVWSTPLTAMTETGLRMQRKNSSKCRTRTRWAMRRCWFSTNKQDMFNAVTAAKVIEKSGLHNLRKRE